MPLCAAVNIYAIKINDWINLGIENDNFLVIWAFLDLLLSLTDAFYLPNETTVNICLVFVIWRLAKTATLEQEKKDIDECLR